MKIEKKAKKSTKKAPISPVLKSLELFKTATFPLTRMSSVRTTVQIIQCEQGMAFSTRKNKETKLLEVTRIK
jgi:hypothetical protein